VISLYVTGKCNVVGTLSITLNDEKKRDMRYLGGHTSNPINRGILDSNANSKKPVKKH